MLKNFLGLLILLCLFIQCRDDRSPNELYTYKDGKVYYKGEKNDNVVFQLGTEPTGLHPLIGTQANRGMVLIFTGQQLLTLHPGTAEPVPVLAKELPVISEDGLRQTYEIHPDATWEDGRSITLEDVLFSFKAALCPLTENRVRKSYLSFIKDARIENERFVVEVKEKSIYNILGITNFVIIDRAFFDPDNVLASYSIPDFINRSEEISEDEALKNWAETFNGADNRVKPENLQGLSGPYKVEDWITGQQVILKKKENYWGRNLEGMFHRAIPEKIIFKFMKDEYAIELQIKQQEIDISTVLTTSTYDALNESELVKTHYDLPITRRFSRALLLLNNRPDGIKRPMLFDQVETRQAIAHLIPMDRIIATFLPDSTKRLTSPLSVIHQDANPDLAPIPFDPEKAAQLLAKAGWKDTDDDGILDKMISGKKQNFEFEFAYPGTMASLDEIVEMIAAEMKKVGIICKGTKPARIVTPLAGKDFDAILLALSNAPVPHNFFPLWHSTNWPNGQNYTGYANAEVDTLSKQLSLVFDKEERRKIAYRIQEILHEELPAIPLYNPTHRMAIHKRYNNVELLDNRPLIWVSQLEVLRDSSD